MLRKVVECGLIDITWLRMCTLFDDIAHDPRWQAIRDEVAERATAVLAAFQAASG